MKIGKREVVNANHETLVFSVQKTSLKLITDKLFTQSFGPAIWPGLVEYQSITRRFPF